METILEMISVTGKILVAYSLLVSCLFLMQKNPLQIKHRIVVWSTAFIFFGLALVHFGGPA